MRRVLPLLALGCNDAPLWPDDAWSPEGEAPWSGPSDAGCDRFDDPGHEIDGFLYCGDEFAFDSIIAVDDPIYSPCSSVVPGAVDPVMAVFDGVRARAYQLAALDRREIVHTEWDGQDVLLAYCPVIAGGEVFHREVDGRSQRFDVAGMWGSANTVTPREQLASGEDYTVYTTWDGHALFGPGRPGALRDFGALVHYPTAGEFVERYGSLGAECEVWFGQEELGIGCVEACARRTEICGQGDLAPCERDCAMLPRSRTECMMLAGTCEEQRACGAARTGPPSDR